ncbi:glycosyltransferase family 2 protein [Foetidibacter luteolus]|uniref:glycosyltransferase family 2 protein n=1 Tax=Foetidibacter luteolus TaxID=2608880 RepID=UPI00129B2A71|nr:glycosyltransferase family 2 protein [Foetidibacter luteolus]
MLAIKIVFWLSIFFLLYAYVGYALITWLLVKLGGKKKPLAPVTEYPAVSFIVAAYNEEAFIEEKIKNTLNLDYPKEKLEIIIVTDGSTDATPQLVSQHEGVTLMHKPERMGKSAALNRAVPLAKHPIIVMCDANTVLNADCIQELVKHYQDEKVGGVAGEKRVLSQEGITQQEGVYWKYESALKKLDAQYHTIVGAAGELFSFRKNLWTNIEKDAILDDFMISMRIVQKGYQVKYEPKAYAMETASASVKEESKRKVRIAAGGFQSITRLASMFNIFKYGKASFLYISHRVLRWAVCPFCLVLLLGAGIYLGLTSGELFYQVALIAQLAGYSLMLLNYLLGRVNRRIPMVQPFQYFVFMNICVIRGFFRYIKGKQSVTWERAERQVIAAQP